MDEEDGERSDMAFLKDLLSSGPGGSDDFSREWQDAFGMFDPPSVPAASAGAEGSGPAARPPSNPPSPTGFLPSQLLDHSLSSTGELGGQMSVGQRGKELFSSVYLKLFFRLGDPAYVPGSAPAAPHWSEPDGASDSRFSSQW